MAVQTEQWLNTFRTNKAVLSALTECYLRKVPAALGCRFLVGSGWREFLN